MTDSRRTLMWEAAAVPGRSGALLDWARNVAAPAVAAMAEVRVFRSDDHRVVIIAVSHDDAEPDVPAVPEDLVRRPPHAWPFTEVGVTTTTTAPAQ